MLEQVREGTRKGKTKLDCKQGHASLCTVICLVPRTQPVMWRAFKNIIELARKNIIILFRKYNAMTTGVIEGAA